MQQEFDLKESQKRTQEQHELQLEQMALAAVVSKENDKDCLNKPKIIKRSSMLHKHKSCQHSAQGVTKQRNKSQGSRQPTAGSKTSGATKKTTKKFKRRTQSGINLNELSGSANFTQRPLSGVANVRLRWFINLS